MKFSLLSSLALLILVQFAVLQLCVFADDAATADSRTETETGSESDAASGDEFVIPDDATLLKMKVKQLKEILGRKGPTADCLACTSKREYVDRIRETESWPDVAPTPSPSSDPDLSDEELRKLFEKTKDPDYMADLRKKLKEAGLDANLFNAKDFDASQFAKQFETIRKPGDANGKADGKETGSEKAESEAESQDGDAKKDKEDL